MGNKDLIETELKNLELLARKMLAQGQTIAPMIVLFTPKGAMPIIADWKDRQEKYAMVQAVAKMASRERATAFSFLLKRGLLLYQRVEI